MRIYLSPLCFALSVCLLAACAPLASRQARVAYAEVDAVRFKNFLPLEEGRLYTSAEPDMEMLRWLMESKRVRVFVSLRGDIPLAQEEYISANKGTLHKFSWDNERVPPEKELKEVFALMAAASVESAVHVFCHAGVDRTGYARAYYRFYAQGWSSKDAIAEMYSFFHLPNALDRDLKAKFRGAK